MPLYFFNVVDSSGEVMRDLEGISLPNLAAVREEAEESARQIVAEAMRMGEAVDGRRFQIADENGTDVLTFPFKDAIKLP